MSKLSFRARALDAAKPLPVYRNRDLPDLTDCVSISRAVPQMPTGMEKEEELEHHLQRAISAQQVFREKKENMVIPVPEAESNTTYYDRLYKGEVKVPKQLIHIQPLGLDMEQPDYDMDSEDETLLNRLNRKMEIKPLQFETMVDRLEKASTQQLVSVSEAKLLLNEDDYLLKSVYDYWLRKRKNWQGPTLIPHIKQEKRDGSTNNDAYVAFRRRTEKMQTRKNRKNDEASYEKMLRLRREFSRTVTILEMIKRREKSKRELLHLTLEVVERRYQMGDFSADILREVTLPLVEKPLYSAPVTHNNRHKADVKMQKKPLSIRDELSFDLIRPKKKSSRRDRLCPPQRRPGRPPGPYTVNKADIKQYDFHSSGEDDSSPPPVAPLSPQSSADDEENNPDGVFVFRRKAGCQYLSPRVETMDGVEGECPEIVPLCLRHSLTELSLPPHWRGLSRRRLGRGGRIILDRASSALDPLLKQLDSLSDPVSRTRTSSCLLSDPSLASSGSSPPSLSEVFNNIQTLRRCCFRPRPSQDQREGGDRTTGSRFTCRLSGHRNTSAGGITEEQYHSHQQQLVQMQKQQLEQLQLQNSTVLCRQTSQLEPHRTQSTKSTESTSKTLDSASAHFAASAVISAPPPHGPLNSENKPYKTSVNGVIHPSGPSRLPYSSTSLSRSGLSARGSSSLPAHSSSSPQSLPNQRSQVGAVSPAHPHSSRPSAPPTSALKLATVAASLDRVPKVTAASSLPRDAHEPERLLNGLSETTLAMEVT